MNLKFQFTLLLFLLTGSFILSCSREDVSLGRAELPVDYSEQFDQWHEQRLYDLTHPTGWMRLAGLFWLEEGSQTFGRGSQVSFQFPDLKPGILGDFTLRNDSVFIRSEVTDEIMIGSQRLERGVSTLVYAPASQDGTNELGESTPEYAPILTFRNLEWLVIKREDLLGIRLFNKKNSYVDSFRGFRRFPIEPSWVVRARLKSYDQPRTLSLMNILGQISEVESPGILEFQIKDEVYTLTPMTEGDKLFIVFGDATNQDETYESGRYLYVDFPPPGKTMTMIDFNKAYNPPCSYTSFSTCQLPPPENRLLIPIQAGELRPELSPN